MFPIVLLASLTMNNSGCWGIMPGGVDVDLGWMCQPSATVTAPMTSPQVAPRPVGVLPAEPSLTNDAFRAGGGVLTGPVWNFGEEPINSIELRARATTEGFSDQYRNFTIREITADSTQRARFEFDLPRIDSWDIQVVDYSVGRHQGR